MDGTEHRPPAALPEYRLEDKALRHGGRNSERSWTRLWDRAPSGNLADAAVACLSANRISGTLPNCFPTPARSACANNDLRIPVEPDTARQSLMPGEEDRYKGTSVQSAIQAAFERYACHGRRLRIIQTSRLSPLGQNCCSIRASNDPFMLAILTATAA